MESNLRVPFCCGTVIHGSVAAFKTWTVQILPLSQVTLSQESRHDNKIKLSIIRIRYILNLLLSAGVHASQPIQHVEGV